MKGAPERVLDMCTTAHITGPDGSAKDVTLTPADREAILAGCGELGSHGERVLAFCDRAVSESKDDGGLEEEQMVELVSKGMRFLGLISLMDPPRAEVPGAIKTCREAGIRVMMVTGDHHATAAAIARMVNIITAERVLGFDYVANVRDGVVESIEDSRGGPQAMPALVLTGDKLDLLDEAMWAHVLKVSQG